MKGGALAGVAAIDCIFIGNDTAIYEPELQEFLSLNSLFINNGICVCLEQGTLTGYMSRCILAFNETIGISPENVPLLLNSVLYYNESLGSANLTTLGCNVLWYDSTQQSQAELSRNSASGPVFFVDPLFCDTTLLEEIGVSVTSPCLPSNNECGDLIGNVTICGGCGDADLQMGINVADLTFLVAYIFQSGPAPVPIEAGETDGLPGVNVADITYLVAYLFQSGPTPVCP
jgi:hypothetical protein